jgi:molecular chaperone GrpE
MDDEGELMMPPGEGAEKEPENAGGSEAQTSTPVAVPPEDYEKLLAEKNDLFDRLLRTRAELDNFRKRTQREKDDLRQFAAEDLIRSLLPILDGFERALKQRDDRVPKAFYDGLELIYRDIREVLGRAGLAPIDTAGQMFDPHLHQAVETVKTTEYRENEIVGELQRGYKLKNKLLRPAIVRVATGGPPAAPALNED